LEYLKSIYIKRKQGCIDMLDRLSEQFDLDFDVLLARVGIDENEMLNDDEVLRFLDMYEEYSISESGHEEEKKKLKALECERIGEIIEDGDKEEDD
ncbi:MAG: hypothetical protein ACMG6E_10460, partial [Candidatus Roizmanbacteria bacterium]